MATRICPDCGAQYVATVRRCIECDVVLVDGVAPDAGSEGDAVSAGARLGEGDQVGYELDGWGNQLKVTLEGMLDRAGVPRAWEAGALVVSAQDEDTVDDLIATLEGGAAPDLDDDTPKVALEIEGLDADGHADLDARLLAQSIPHAWDDDGALLVAEEDEDRVLAVIEEALDHEADADDDGLAAHQALSALYVAVDKLVKGPDDRKPATAYVRAAAPLDALSVPYGFALADWSALKEDASALAALVSPYADPLPTTPSDATHGDGDVDADADADAQADDVAPDPADGQPAESDEELGGESASGDGDDRVAEATVAARALRARLVDLV